MKYRLFILLLTLPVLSGCTQHLNKSLPDKINGVSFVAASHPAEQVHVDPVLKINANFAAVMPFGFIRGLDSTELIYDTERQWFGETKAGAKQYIELLKSNGIKIMLKPQIWIRRGEFTGYLEMKSEEEWQELETSYRGFILNYAELAQEMDVALFCIGTELERFIVNRPEYWNQLILEIKQVYDGPLTYAANWDEYKRVPFWKELDFIGVDAYFPVSDLQTPTVEAAVVGWDKWKTELIEVSETNDRPVLFTEYGYRSMDFAGKEPWNSDHSITEVNLDAQVNLMQGLFTSIYDQPWFAGGFIWKWFTFHNRVGGSEDSQFTPQNKPVEAIIETQFRKSY